MEKKNNTLPEPEKVKSSKVAARLQKKRAAISYANMSPELAAAFKEKYPKGYADYMGDIFKVEKPDGSFFYAISLEIPEAIYLIKIDVKVDDYEDIENGLFGDTTADVDDAADGGAFPEEDSSTSFASEDADDE